ncbi:MAG: hypothetical protein K2F81_06220 [Ruminococcus sp.]|nr:hypothetical protein [Ruminococcus sp.]
MDNYFDSMLDINELPKIKNGRVWYVAILPLLACYLENFAVNIILGVLLWLSVIIICPLICVFDEKHLRSFGLDTRSLYKVRYLPPIYLYKRSVVTKQSNTSFILFIVFLAYAVMNNGFVQALRIDDNTFIRSIQSSYVSSLTEYNEITSYNAIGEQVEAFANSGSVDWKFSQDENFRYVTASGKCTYKGKNNQNFELVFQIDFDGYALISTEVKSLSVEGRTLVDAEFNSLLYKILIETDADESSLNSLTESNARKTEFKKA